MATGVKYQQFAEDLANGVHDLVGTDHTLKLMISNTAPNVATHAVRADVTEIAGGGGYTSGGIDVQNNGTESGGTVSVTGVDVTFTASGGTITGRYLILYNDTPTSPADPLIQYWDYLSTFVLADGESLLADFGSTLLTVA